MVLDDPREIARLDAAGMLSLTRRFGDMMLEGWEAGADLAIPPFTPDAVVTLGMGGSGIGGDLLRVLLVPTASVPVVVVKDDRLPAFVGPRTLVFACSYSGDTEETLAACSAALAAGSSVIAVTSGGRLAEEAAQGGYPVVRVPRSLPPRAALPYLLAPMLRVAVRLGLTDLSEADVREAAAGLAELAGRWGPAVPAGDNPTKRLAASLHRMIPVIYAASPGVEPVAQRWKTQLNENSKVFAVSNTFPELTHNEVMGWDGVADGQPPLYLIFLRDPGDGPRSALRLEAVRDLTRRRARGQAEVWSQGTGRLARLCSLIMFGDFVSSYLAVISGTDPTPIESISRIKQRLEGTEGRQEASR